MRPTTFALVFVLLSLGVGLTACGSSADSAAPANPEAAYALGLLTGRGLSQMQLSPAELAEFERGLRDYRSGKSGAALLGALGPAQAFQVERMNAAAEHARIAGEEFLRSASGEPGAEQLPSGIVFRSMTPGKGPTPTPSDIAVVRAEGTLPDGTVFQSSEKQGKPIGVEMASGIPCLTEPLARMAVGGRARITCPAQSGYAVQDRPPLIAPGAALRFELELVAVRPSGAGIHR